MADFVQGQRWVVDSEPELGLGTVTSVQGRRVNIFFEQSDCERTYAKDNAPLTRITFAIDDEIKTAKGETKTVTLVHEHEGLLFYETSDGEITAETSLSSEVQLNQPFMRLMTGQLDKPNWFSFKRQLSDAIAKVWQSRLNGLLGIRANLIPHQLYVAWSACEREKIRVLLADEVGLGKTIEAGMILSRLIKLERAQRVLIAVPKALQVQWLVELIRRFSLHAELYKAQEHDFHSGQIHIVPHEIFAEKSDELSQGEFDLVIVDEAHRLTPESEAFKTLEQLSNHVEHLVLLTATPEQLGLESHFARLKLLDPAKFSSLDAFIAQEEKYIQLNEDIRQLPASRDRIIDQYQLDLAPEDSEDKLIDQLLDSHGVGRLMFRNVRSAIAGFPKRVVVPEVLGDDSWDEKFEWLSQWLKNNKGEKILAICHDIKSVFACEDYLWQKHGIDASVFHEEQSLIERDRAATYFSDEEGGSQVLICSEIGSEGRNFQFSSHLVCLDIPEHPDLLEQRIGRLDRIGQQKDINIHMLYGEGSKTQIQFRWFHEVLDCVQQQNPAATPVHDEFWHQLDGSLENTEIISLAKEKLAKLREDIKNGRDALLEKNSCRQPMANSIAEKISTFEQNTPLELVETASDLLQFYFEETYQGAYNIIPSDKMLIPSLPGIPPEGIEVTFDRNIANTREEVKFISWDAPFIQGLWELLHFSELGSASVATLPSPQLPAGHCLLEACFDLVIQSPLAAECRPFLDGLTVRSLAIDISENDLSNALPEDALQKSIQAVKKHLAREIIKSQKEEIPGWYKKCELFADNQKQTLIEKAVVAANQYFDGEITRLHLLKKRNDFFDDEDITTLENKAREVVTAIKEKIHLHLSSVRLIVITDTTK
ncbi:SNF2-related protein [Agarilytica rhodophyticola]|uniref:SNF2-related protein n=1 Tax=Agarilytica rhodophyticola TaxID=1737490 RepID=UPI000B344AB7|nr:SNF2-related protein [Agarilytica rhodophyticola]